MQPFRDIFSKYYTKYIKMSSIIKDKYTDARKNNETTLHNYHKYNYI